MQQIKVDSERIVDRLQSVIDPDFRIENVFNDSTQLGSDI